MAKETKENKGQVPVFTIELRADDPTAIGTIKNRCRQLTRPGDADEIALLKGKEKEFAEWGKEKK